MVFCWVALCSGLESGWGMGAAWARVRRRVSSSTKAGRSWVSLRVTWVESFEHVHWRVESLALPPGYCTQQREPQVPQ